MVRRAALAASAALAGRAPWLAAIRRHHGEARTMARGGAWVDYNNDGLLDLMVSTNAAIPWLGSDKLLRNVNGFLFQDATPESFIYPRKGRGIAWADFDDDGDQDLYTVGGTGCPCNWEDLPDNWLDHAQNRMFRNDDGILVDVTNDVTIDGLPGRGVAAADYDNDGDIDLYLSSSSLVLFGMMEGVIFLNTITPLYPSTKKSGGQCPKFQQLIWTMMAT